MIFLSLLESWIFLAKDPVHDSLPFDYDIILMVS